MLSRKRRSITGNRASKDVSVSIKPTSARKIIRRFHLLINKRRIVCDKLGIPLVDNDEKQNAKNISQFLDSSTRSYYELGFTSTDMEPQLLQVQSCQMREKLVECLGYIMSQVNKRGGLKDYQLASRIGQTANRGGDSSKLLVSWLKELGHTVHNKMRALEIGSLSTKNQISTCGMFQPVTRIDLESSQPGIVKQDFMQRQLPRSEEDRFDLISCSLVLNFVPTPLQRGQMCERFASFLLSHSSTAYLFVVLPLPCISNSRYMDKEHYLDLMGCLNYSLVKYHEAKKLCYMLLRHGGQSTEHVKRDRFTKKDKLHNGPNMNNFCIILPAFKSELA
ncbi:YBR141C [Zygosaccharomyces parabailii]|nr:YBR141C [Zygosaccharomyces parabailii]CDH12661.1 related to UPF0657 nucleolar protein YBR141C [Zygosaccharomyces bailii ISA1307]